MNTPIHRSLCLALAPVLISLAGFGFAQQTKDSTPPIVTPDKTVLGQTYAQWSAAWWKWFAELPDLPNHPLYCSPSYDVTLGQTGNVWFLAGPFGPCVRTVSIPAGKWLFLPMANVEASSLEMHNPQFYGCTPAQQAAAAKVFVDYVRRPFVEVDGIRLLEPERYRFVSPQFTFNLPAANIFGVPPGTTTQCSYVPIPPPMEGTSVSDGYWAMIKPLPVGYHVIRFGGDFRIGGTSIGNVDTTYKITVF